MNNRNATEMQPNNNRPPREPLATSPGDSLSYLDPSSGLSAPSPEAETRKKTELRTSHAALLAWIFHTRHESPSQAGAPACCRVMRLERSKPATCRRSGLEGGEISRLARATSLRLGGICRPHQAEPLFQTVKPVTLFGSLKSL